MNGHVYTHVADLGDGTTLHVTLTEEGLTLDHVDATGEVVATFGRMYDELLRLVGPSETERLQAEYGGYWGEHPKATRADWQQEVAEDVTSLSYWDWVLNQLQSGD